MTARVFKAPVVPRADRPAGPGLLAAVAGSAMCRCTPGDLPGLRRAPRPVLEGWGRGSASVLRHSDEQTVAGVAAVFTAVESMGGDLSRYADWGVVSASSYFGRATVGDGLRKFGAEGVWGISPHMIPHFALHSLSGTISLALGLHGPTLGVGGGNRSDAEGFLAAMTWLAAGVVAGVWLILSVGSTRPGEGAVGTCAALALALVNPSVDDQTVIRVTAGREPQGQRGGMDLTRLNETLAVGTVRKPITLAADPAGGLVVEMVPCGANGTGDRP